MRLLHQSQYLAAVAGLPYDLKFSRALKRVSRSNSRRSPLASASNTLIFASIFFPLLLSSLSRTGPRFTLIQHLSVTRYKN